mmetsp:Transcript_21360/g.25446  ORF Transcript_21360/g.25446 Transcript_21360/m.25446 type:complete len:484 (+) Transcript_21360:91-1542(+)|eukprot:CAMPEP_0198270280 /NCGR_PEP_ID=MMETSP1447-20131203/44465_1 /TAXON_ID=420782 /ORGANISM="Chaetoceros dichaeta, Strain CCMP1751" /LENGTH=483 /DNA_ID=CAMNT_0043962225 /DNA_START=76 /DNA_END=1527 /DNA_ORIENTATION=-
MTSLRQSASNAITTLEQRKGAKLQMAVGDDEGCGNDAPKSNSSSRRNRRKFKSRLDAKQQKLSALTVVILTIIILIAMVTSPYHQIIPSLKTTTPDNEHYLHNSDDSKSLLKLSNLRDKPKKKKRVNLDCVVVEAVISTQPVTPTFTASFPGSGARLAWQLIEALTGLKTSDDLTANGNSNFVSIKTHYPSREGRLIPESEKIPHAILLIRHPIYVLPTYFRLLYRYETKSPHLQHPPLEKWIEWRNNYFDRHLQVWRRHTEYWMDHYKRADRLVIAYEKLVDEDYGADEALRVAEFLDRSEGVMSFPPEHVPCAWHKIVKAKKNIYHVPRRLQEVEVIDKFNETGVGVVQDEVGQDKNGDAVIGTEPLEVSAAVVEVVAEVQPGTVPVQVLVEPVATAVLETQTQAQKVEAMPKISTTRKVISDVKYDPPYNKQQLKDMIQILTQLLERYRDDEQLAPVLVAYIDEVAQRSQAALDDNNINF